MLSAKKLVLHLVRAGFEVALELATQLDFLYDRGSFDERRLPCETALKRLYVEDGKIIGAEYNAPSAIIARTSGSETVPGGGAGGSMGRTRTSSIAFGFKS